MKNKYQYKFKSFYSRLNNPEKSNKTNAINILNEHLNISEYIPTKFYHSYYAYVGKNRTYTLEAMLNACIIQRIFGYNKTSMLIDLLQVSSEVRNFCGFKSVPHKSQFSRFKSKFHQELHNMFNHLVLKTEPICGKLGENFASHVIFDTSGILPYVKENNNKHFFKIVNNLKKIHKGKSINDIYKIAFSKMPKTAEVNKKIRLMYINGSFNYALKFGIITNAHGIVRSLSFIDDLFLEKHTDVKEHLFDEQSNEQEKSASDSILLKPCLDDFFEIFKSTSYKFHTFLGDAAFDKYENYSMLINEYGFNRSIIGLNPRRSSKQNVDDNVIINEKGIPVCNVCNLPFKNGGICKSKKRSTRRKFHCPKTKVKKGKRTCFCETPCSDSIYGRTTYTYADQDLRLNPGLSRSTFHFNKVYKRRVVIERTIDSFKSNMGLGNTRQRSGKTIKSDLILCGITQLINVILADKLCQLKNFKSIAKLLKAS